MEASRLASLLKKYPCQALPSQSGKASSVVITCPVRLAYISLLEPRAKMSNDPASPLVYRATLLFPKAADYSIIKQVATSTAYEKFGEQKVRELAASQQFITPFKKQDRLAGKSTGFEAGAIYLEPWGNKKPAIIDALRNPLTDADAIYSGMWARVKLNAYSYDRSGKRGVGFGLMTVQKLADDDRFGGDPTAGFSDVDAEDMDAPAPASNGAGHSAPASSLF